MVYDLIMPAAGKAARSGLSYSKVFYPVHSKVLLDYSLAPFLADPECRKIILVIDPNEAGRFRSYEKQEKIELVPGGQSRSESVLNGLGRVKEDFVLIHDGARPFITTEIIENVKQGLKSAPASIASIPCRDTIKLKEENKVTTLDRTKFYQSQTPQGFKTQSLKEAFDWLKHQPESEKTECSDEAQLMELAGKAVKLVEGSSRNLKITDPSDFDFLSLLK